MRCTILVKGSRDKAVSRRSTSIALMLVFLHQLSEMAKRQGREPKIYIHCTAGMGRAPATACIYLVWKHGYNLDHARNHVKYHRPIVAPNYEAMKLACQNGLD